MAVPGVGAPPAPREAIRVTSLGPLVSAADSSSYAFGNIAVPRPGLLVVFAGGARTGSGTRQVNSISIDGNSDTPTVRSSVANECGGMRGLLVAAGDIPVAAVFSGNMQGAGAWCSLLEGFLSDVPVDGYTAVRDSTVTAHQTVMDYVAGDVGIFGDVMLRGTTIAGISDGVFDGAYLIEDTSLDYDVAGGHFLATEDQTSKTVTFTSSGYSAGVACGLVFR